MLRTLEPQKGAENKNAEADIKNPCSYKTKSVYVVKIAGLTLQQVGRSSLLSFQPALYQHPWFHLCIS